MELTSCRYLEHLANSALLIAFSLSLSLSLFLFLSLTSIVYLYFTHILVGLCVMSRALISGRPVDPYGTCLHCSRKALRELRTTTGSIIISDRKQSSSKEIQNKKILSIRSVLNIRIYTFVWQQRKNKCPGHINSSDATFLFS